MENNERSMTEAYLHPKETKQTPLSDGRTPIVFTGNNNTVTVIETQNNDASAVRMLDAIQRESESAAKYQQEIIKGIMAQIPTFVAMITKMSAQSMSSSTDKKKKPTVKKVAKKKVKPTKRKK